MNPQEAARVGERTIELLRENEKLRAERDALLGLRPELSDRPPHDNGPQYQHPALPRYGLRWNGPTLPLSVPMADGYWTPFHRALSAIQAVEKDARCWQQLRGMSADPGFSLSADSGGLAMFMKLLAEVCSSGLAEPPK